MERPLNLLWGKYKESISYFCAMTAAEKSNFPKVEMDDILRNAYTSGWQAKEGAEEDLLPSPSLN